MPMPEYIIVSLVPVSGLEEIIRCANCIHFELDINGYEGHCNHRNVIVNRYDFCSKGTMPKEGDAK